MQNYNYRKCVLHKGTYLPVILKNSLNITSVTYKELKIICQQNYEERQDLLPVFDQWRAMGEDCRIASDMTVKCGDEAGGMLEERDH